MEWYKKWIIVAIAALAGGIVIVSFMSRQSPGPEQPVRERASMTPPPSGPLLDEDINRVVPIDELGVDLSNPQALAALGDRYFESGKYAQTIEIYRKVLQLSPGDVDTYNDLGLAYHYTGKPESAVEILKKGTEVRPSFQRIWLSLGFVLMSTGSNDEAKSALQRAEDLDPETDVGKEAARMIGLIN